MRVKVSKGGDMAIAVDPKKMKHVEKAFSNNKGAYLSLTPTELQTNMKIIKKMKHVEKEFSNNKGAYLS